MPHYFSRMDLKKDRIDLVVKILTKKLVAGAYFHLGRHRRVEPYPCGEAGFS